MLKAIDLFSGIGGLSLGFENAGIEVEAAYEWWDNAVNVYKSNFNHPIYNIDLSKVHDLSIFTKYNPDIIMGGPPCQDYSAAGKRNENGGRANKTIDFANIVSLIKPKYFVMENVDVISKYETLAKAKNIFKQNGYGLTQEVLCASYFNVPQSRKRFFLIGILNSNDDEIKEQLSKKELQTPMTVREYLGNALGVNNYYRHPRNYNRRGIFSIDEPSPTIRGVNRPIPPKYKRHKNDTADPKNVRSLTSIERSYIQTFPKSFDFSNEKSKTNLELMIGNAVPVNLATHIAKVLVDYDNNKNKNTKTNYVEQLNLRTINNLYNHHHFKNGRPRVNVTKNDIKKLSIQGFNKAQVAKKLKISRTTVYRILNKS